MKRVSYIFLFLLFILPLQAKKVNEQQVRIAVSSFIHSRMKTNATIKSIETIGSSDDFYLVNLSPRGWVIVGGDDVIEPIIAYSSEEQIAANQLPENMLFMLNHTNEAITQVSKSMASAHPYWRGYTSISTKAVGVEVEPLIKVNWDQSSPYNKYCPEKKEVHALVGCVAVAMSQAMSVQRYPARPKGSISYGNINYGGLSINFDAEKGYDWDAIISGSNNYDETARLLAHAGFSVKMDYGEDMSAVLTSNIHYVSDALRNNFSYSDATYYWQERYSGDWEQMLINELVAGRAIVYNGVDYKNNSGHSFNIDGYDGSGHFHVNWGWGGQGNAYFLIDGLKYSYLHFDSSIIAIVGIGGADQVLKNITLETQQIEEGLPAESIVSRILVNDEVPRDEFIIEISDMDGKQVPFIVKEGLLRTTEVLYAKNQSSYELVISVNDPHSGETLKQIFTIQVEPWKSLGSTTSLSYNRNDKQFKLKTKHNVTYLLQSPTGSVISQGELSPIPELTINSQILSAGINTLTLTCGSETVSIKLITAKEEE